LIQAAFSFFAGCWKKMEQLSVRRCTSVCTSQLMTSTSRI
jgi:hypothetical protein